MADIDTIPRAVSAQDSDLMARILFFPDPEPLPPWQKADSFETIFVVRILDSNPKAFNIQVRRIDLQAPISQAQVNQTHVDAAPSAPFVLGATNGVELNLSLNTSTPALVLFEMYDPMAEFLIVKTGAAEFANGVVKGDVGPDLIYQAEWISNPKAPNRAVGVILDGVVKGGHVEQQYGLGVRMQNNAGGYTDVNIDPKIENDGDD
jgi:hypothetical protein